MKNNIWCSKEDIDAYTNFRKKQEFAMFRYFMFGKADVTAKRRENRDDRKCAWIKVGNTRVMACLHPDDTSVAYKLDTWYKYTWEKWSKFEFERWATSFDF